MNKKGFTLVELLAVIAILAILVLVAMPNVLGMFNQAKSSTFATEVQTIYKNAQQQYITDSMTKNASTVTYDSETSSTTDKIAITTTKKYHVTVNKDGVQTIAVWDDSFFFNGSSVAATGAITVKSVNDIKITDAANEVKKCDTGKTFKLSGNFVGCY